ncbi:hypothetical protein BpHYR1_037753 [Brachionus plicatilis]|uniref:Uncharacterized protein n=1 Tax=Brachionus plicatilis TaxID=10195 RepID=A0A3M7RAE2_BRAPC|nr:hypothetical protein BpHYR1_037753 [Brachionus plicatilis]
MRHYYQNFDINCSIFSRSVSGKKSGLNAALKSRILKINAALGGKALRILKKKTIKEVDFLSDAIEVKRHEELESILEQFRELVLFVNNFSWKFIIGCAYFQQKFAPKKKTQKKSTKSLGFSMFVA